MVKTHMAREVEVEMNWQLGKRKKSNCSYRTAQLCTGEILLGITYYLFQENYLTKRWNKVTCKNCLKFNSENKQK